MIWLYRLQQRLSITRHESLAVVTLTVLFITGLAVRHVQQQQVPPVTADTLVARTDTAAAPETNDGPPAPSPEDPINVNAAPRTALEALPGIGPALADRIVHYRSEQRPFQKVEELKRVRGIGSKTLSDLRPLVRTAPADSTDA
ncbi:MAG: helix-hairpin-helix domain-containing protein [Salinibacter sp.]